MVSSDFLKKVAVYGATVSVLGAAFFHHRIQAKIASQEYYKKSLEVLKDHQHAVDAIGKPLRVTYLHLGRDDIKVDNTHAQIVIPIKGSKTKGSLYSFASRKEDGGWVLERVELEVEPERDRIKILPSEG